MILHNFKKTEALNFDSLEKLLDSYGGISIPASLAYTIVPASLRDSKEKSINVYRISQSLTLVYITCAEVSNIIIMGDENKTEQEFYKTIKNTLGVEDLAPANPCLQCNALTVGEKPKW